MPGADRLGGIGIETERPVITRAELDALRARTDEDDDAADIAGAERALAESDVRYPAEVLDAMLAGETPIAAWRKYRGMSQVALAKGSGITQAAISRLEAITPGTTNPFGRMVIRRGIAKALGVSLEALQPLGD